MVDSVKSLNGLTLSNAQKSGRVQEFASQQEARGIGPVNQLDFDLTVKKLVMPLRQRGQTSGSRAPGDSTGR